MLSSISINNTSAAYPESINENNNDEVNGLVQEFKNLFNGKEGISTCIKHLLELIKNAIRVNDNPDRFNINNSSVTYINIGSNDTDYITIGIDNKEPIKLLASYKDKELARTIINDNIVEKTHDDINNAEFTDGGIDDRSDIGIDSNDTDDITFDIDIDIDIENQEPIKSPTNDENKKLGQTLINENVVENTHDINNKKMIFSAIKEIYNGDPDFIFDKISRNLIHTVTKSDENGISKPTDLFTWHGKDKKYNTLAIVIKNTNGNDYLSLGYYDQDNYHIKRGIRINGDSLTQYCNENARNASASFKSNKAIMAELFATGINHQFVNELNGERLREPNEVFKRYGRAIRYDFQVDDAKYKCGHLKEIVSTLFGNEVNVDHSQKIYKHFKDLEGKIEERLQNRQAEYQNEINQLYAPGVNFDDI
ncbi:hypothetical protein AJR17_002725 [Shigella boydii]|uniref:Uncharacterized protein n=1 Tax=Shigella boydii TaxID=621 RepID=A0A1S9JNH9_SHIBO|nr:hypothetical protein [Shigella boydii]EGD7152383.1 hypothetical protein [Shigella dysenteriae]EHX5808556.1 hypothetical protein [Shigella dysenteriae]EIH6587877.1 hypothetical protein [Shigella boydii]OOO84363.1 hypothetical protein AJR17_002725 [Shigella boydii]HBK0598541.1 hypothetical protein [Shigella boydii]